LKLVKTKDILASLGSIKKENQILVGFALETENLIENAKKKLENNFMNDVGNAIDMYISMNTDSLKFGSNSVGKINKGHGIVSVYVTIKSFDDIVGSGIISRNDLINPVNNNRCDGNIKIYRDDDYLYYYSVSSVFLCFI
jgi:hypothetical protein